MHNVPRIGVGCVVEREGMILLGQRKGAHAKGFWAFPGGHLEFGENVEACAREHTQMEEGTKHYITLFVFIDAPLGEPQLMEPEKCLGWKWFSWNDLPKPLFSPISSLLANGEIPRYAARRGVQNRSLFSPS